MYLSKQEKSYLRALLKDELSDLKVKLRFSQFGLEAEIKKYTKIAKNILSKLTKEK